MPIDAAKPVTFKPARPIFLNEQNLGVKTRDQAIYNIEQLRSAHWLCIYAEVIRPMHLSFDSTTDFDEFKKSAQTLGVKLTEPVIKHVPDFIDAPIVSPEPNSTTQLSNGKTIVD